MNSSSKITLCLMGYKGLSVLRAIVKASLQDFVSLVIVSRDKNIVKDYYDEIIACCFENKIIYADRLSHPVITSYYVLAIAWRWLIPTDDKKLIILHDSILPKYRGFAPLVNMLKNMEPYIGVTAIYANDEYDKGEIIGIEKTKVSYPIRIEKAIELVSELYVSLVLKIAESLNRGEELTSQPQDESMATYSLWLDEEDYRIDWSLPADKILQFIYSVGLPYNGAYTCVDDQRVYRIWDAEIEKDVSIVNRTPGKLIFMKDGCPIIVCGQGLLKITAMTDEAGQNVLPLNKFRVRLY